jgi:hypothetical protein
MTQLNVSDGRGGAGHRRWPNWRFRPHPAAEPHEARTFDVPRNQRAMLNLAKLNARIGESG